MLARRHIEHIKLEVELEKVRRDQADYRAALVCMVINNVHVTKKANLKKISDFMPKYVKQTEKNKQQTDEEMFAMVKMLNAAFGGVVN